MTLLKKLGAPGADEQATMYTHRHDISERLQRQIQTRFEVEHSTQI
ncbi:Rop family plasmid primer RNA-binding protein [Salmonella enterica]